VIKYEENTKEFILNKDLYDELEQYNGNIGFVIMAGPYRTGKSFLLNKIMGLKEGEAGFRVDPRVNTCTKGI